MPTLKIRLLGAPEIQRDHQPVEVDTRKAIALLAYLTVTGERHTRDALAALLWPDSDQTRARGALRRTLSALNKAIDGEYLTIDRESVQIDPTAPYWLDVAEFEQLIANTGEHGHPAEAVCPACIVPLRAAVDLYRDDFMAGFTLRDSPTFDDWQFFQSDELRRRLAEVLEKLVRVYSDQGEFPTAIEFAHRWLELDILNESAYRQLMQLYAWSGKRNAALQQYRECLRILDNELGVSPLEETTQLYESIKEQRSLGVDFRQQLIAGSPEDQRAKTAETPGSLPPALESAGAEKAATIDQQMVPLVGRTAEWATLQGIYSELEADGHLVAISGEAGIGKTRLAEEFLAHVWTRGAKTIITRCYAGESHLSFGPFVEGLRAALNQVAGTDWLDSVPANQLAEVFRLLPELRSQNLDIPEPPPLEGPGAQARFLEALHQFILRMCAGPHPGILLIDDVQWADNGSLDLLSYFVRRIRGRPLLILLTWREEELESSERLRRLLGEAQRSETATLLDLPRLNPDEVGELLDTVTKRSTPAGLDYRLHQETEGLPFFLVEYLAAIFEKDTFKSEADWSLPGGVRDLLNTRLAAVSETAGQLLTTAAVIGRSFGFGTLQTTSGRSEEETVAALEELIGRGLIREIKDSGAAGQIQYDFSHEKLRNLVYEETSLARRRLLHRRVAEALTTQARHQRQLPLPAAQIAHHYQLAGEEIEAAQYYLLAGDQAANLYANTDALNHYQTALALGSPRAAYLHRACGDLQTLLGAYDAALTSYETAAALSEPNSQALALLEHKLGEVRQRRGEWELAQSNYRAALEALEASDAPELQAHIYADWSLAAHHAGKPEQGRDLAKKALDFASDSDDLLALAQAYNILGVLARNQGDLDQAMSQLKLSLKTAEALDLPAIRIAALNNLALVYNARQDYQQAITLIEQALDLCAQLGDRHRQAALHNNLADLFHASGDGEKAMSELKKAVALFAEIGVEAEDVRPEIWKLTEW